MNSVRPGMLLLLSLFAACSDRNPLQPSKARTDAPSVVAQESSGKPEPAQLPFYARLERDFEPIHTDEWAAIVFYRQPACVPSGFNLLDLFDIPTAFGCPLTVEGFTIFKDPLPTPPVQLNLKELEAVPIWFLRWTDLQAAIGDDVVTISELQGVNSLQVGSASVFQEVLHPGDPVTLILTAKGVLDDGRRFSLEFRYAAGDGRRVRIVFD